jgi:hypothetical protein
MMKTRMFVMFNSVHNIRLGWFFQRVYLIGVTSNLGLISNLKVVHTSLLGTPSMPINATTKMGDKFLSKCF